MGFVDTSVQPLIEFFEAQYRRSEETRDHAQAKMDEAAATIRALRANEPELLGVLASHPDDDHVRGIDAVARAGRQVVLAQAKAGGPRGLAAVIREIMADGRRR